MNVLEENVKWLRLAGLVLPPASVVALLWVMYATVPEGTSWGLDLIRYCVFVEVLGFVTARLTAAKSSSADVKTIASWTAWGFVLAFFTQGLLPGLIYVS